MWHGFSWTFHVIPLHKLTVVWSKSTPNSTTIPCHLSRFYLFPMFRHDMDFGQVQVMEFSWHLLRKWRNFHRIWFKFQPNSPQNDMKKSVLHFLKWLCNCIHLPDYGWSWLVVSCQVSSNVLFPLTKSN